MLFIKLFIVGLRLLFSYHANASFNHTGCVDASGNEVQTVESIKLDTVAIATIDKSGSPVIILNPNLMRTFSPAMQKFIYWHECGHHVLGHLIMRSSLSGMLQEQQADCYGIRVALTLGEFTHSQLKDIQKELLSLGGGDWEHFSGQSRAINIKMCLGDGYDSGNWERCKGKFYENLRFIREATTEISGAGEICLKYGFSSRECEQIRSVIVSLGSGIKKSISILDSQCIYVMEPSFSRTMAKYYQAIGVVKENMGSNNPH